MARRPRYARNGPPCRHAGRGPKVQDEQTGAWTYAGYTARQEGLRKDVRDRASWDSIDDRDSPRGRKKG